VSVVELGSSDIISIRRLLEANGLPTEDLEHSMVHFFGVYDGLGLAGVVGLEPLGEAGLLRSLAVGQELRNSGLGTRLVREVEAAAVEHRVRELFLLTTTAEPFFGRRGYQRRSREEAPRAIQETTEFKSICPSTAAFMAKALPPAPSEQRNQ
jgi:amino-acid N-acetyltransferase